MSRERLYLFDTTLRDGAQTNGVDFTLRDKQQIAKMLDDLGIDYVEGGYPGANPTDTEFFATKPKFDHARFTAFGMTRRPGRSASNDPGLAGLLEAKADAICFVAKSSAYQVRVALETTKEENLASIRDSVSAAKAAGREVMLDCEHFFDGYKENPEFALACARAAYDSGARWVVLCDTNGGTMPHEIETIVGEVVKQIPGNHVGIHAHNDTDQAVANSLAAVRAGARQIQGTLNGLGERCGNANLCSLIPTLRLKREFSDAFDIAVSPDKMATLIKVSRTLDDMLNRAPNRHAPYVGESAFVTKTGIHASAVLKDPQTYEHISPGGGIRAGSGRILPCSSTSRCAGTARTVRCTRPFTFSVHASRRSWKSRWFANTRPGSKFERMNPCERSSAPFACGSRASRITQPTSS